MTDWTQLGLQFFRHRLAIEDPTSTMARGAQALGAKGARKSMCFSATASFVTAGVIAVIGLVSLSRVSEARELPLAATPMVFALQQSIEGLLWLDLPWAPDGSISTSLTFLFLLIAQAFWPVYAPIVALLIEPSARRRRLMLACLAVGLCVGAYSLWWILSRPHGAIILDGHIVYVTEQRRSDVAGLAYLAATGLPLILSSRPAAVALGAVVLAGCATAYVLYWESFVSVWCFFAAGASAVIVFHFERSHRQRMRVARA